MTTVKLPVLPFNEFWINCMINARVSILRAVNPLFDVNALLYGSRFMLNVDIKAPFVEICRRQGWTGLYLRHYQSEKTDFDQYFDFHDIYVETGGESVHELIEQQLNKGFYVQLRLDRFYYPIGIEAGNHHLVHPVTIYGMDSNKRAYYLLEDTMRLGFMEEYELPFEHFEKAFEGAVIFHSSEKIFIRCMKVRADATPLNFDISSVVREIQKKLFDEFDEQHVKNECIEHFGLTTIVQYADKLHEYVLDVQNLSNLAFFLNEPLLYHKKNQKLVEYLAEHHYIERYAADRLHNKYEDLHKQWEIIMGKLYITVHRKLRTNAMPNASLPEGEVGRLKQIYWLEKDAAEDFYHELCT
jgi:hypothetical protein